MNSCIVSAFIALAIGSFGTAFGQTGIPLKNIQGNILFVGVTHDLSNLHALMDDTSRRIFCSEYKEIEKAAKGREIIYVIEGFKSAKAGIFTRPAMRHFVFPECLPDTIAYIGCDNRPDSLLVSWSEMMALTGTVYSDGLDGTEENFSEALHKRGVLNLDALPLDSALFVDHYGKLTGMMNDSFEHNIVRIANVAAKYKCFVVVLCGAVHVASIMGRVTNNNAGYLMCIQPSQMRQVLWQTKLLWTVKQLAKQR